MGQNRRGRNSQRGRAAASATVALTALILAGATFVAPAASAQGSGAKTPKPTTVVKVVARSTFPQILVTKKKKALYIDEGAPCTTQSCLTIWPPLLMPKGKTVPGGVSGLGTTMTSTGQLQVTYHSMPLYTFYQDTKKSLNGDGVGGFVVAQVQ